MFNKLCNDMKNTGIQRGKLRYNLKAIRTAVNTIMGFLGSLLWSVSLPVCKILGEFEVFLSVLGVKGSQNPIAT